MVAYLKKEKPVEGLESTINAIAEIKRRIVFDDRPVPLMNLNKKICTNDSIYT